MKKYIILLILIAFCGNHKMQASGMPTNGDYSNWDWEDQSDGNWKRYLSQGTARWEEINPPFAVKTDKINLLREIYREKDYTYAGNWRLIHAQFGGEHPYFILYNIDRALLRAFVFTENAEYNSVAMTISPDIKGKETKLLHFFEDKQVAVNDPSKFSKDNITVITKAGTNSWAALEAPILFDNTITSKERTDWEIAFFLGKDFDIKLKINGSSVPMDPNGNLLFSHPTAAKSTTNFNADYATVHTQIKNTTDWITKINTDVAKIDSASTSTTPQFLKDYRNFMSSFKAVGNIADIVSGASGAISLFTGFLDLIFGSSKQSSMIVGYSHNLSATGNLSGLFNIPAASISIPGSKDGDRPAWAYNCPLGIMNLTNTPVIKKTKPYYTLENQSGIKKPIIGRTGFIPDNSKKTLSYYGYTFPSVGGQSQLITIGVSKQTLDKIPKKSLYKFDDNLSFNIKEGYEIINTKFALIFKEKTSKYITEESFESSAIETIGTIGSSSIIHYTLKSKNPVYKGLTDGKYIIHYYDPQAQEFTYGTPYLSEKQFKNVTMEVIDGADVSLSAIITYRKKGSDELLLYKGTFKLNIEEEEEDKYFVLDGDPQTNYLLSDYWAGEKLTLSIPSASNHTNVSVTMLPGFVGTPGFSAKATYALYETNNKVETFEYGCTITPPTRATASLEEEATVEKAEAKLYPNPTSGTIYITEVADQTISKVEVLNMGGKLVEVIKGVTTSFDISAHPDGIYIIRVHTNDGVATHRIILRK